MRCSGEVFQLLASVATVTALRGIISGLGVLALQAERSEFHIQLHIVKSFAFLRPGHALCRITGKSGCKPLNASGSPMGLKLIPKMLPKCIIKVHQVFHLGRHWCQGRNGVCVCVPVCEIKGYWKHDTLLVGVYKLAKALRQWSDITLSNTLHTIFQYVHN